MCDKNKCPKKRLKSLYLSLFLYKYWYVYFISDQRSNFYSIVSQIIESGHDAIVFHFDFARVIAGVFPPLLSKTMHARAPQLTKHFINKPTTFAMPNANNSYFSF